MFRKEDRERGAVSAFLMMIFAVLFAFVALFIDYSRMAALQAQSEAALHAAVRSVLSSYDPDLLENYGLFAVGSTDSSYVMSKALKENFNYSERTDKFSLIGAKLDSSEITLSRPLGSYPVFEQQIREEMKYKAPINLVLDLLNKLKPASNVMKEASNTMDVLKKLQKLYDEREGWIDKVYSAQMNGLNDVKALSHSFKTTGAVTGNSGLGENISTLQGAASQYGEYKSKLEEDSGRELQDKLYTLELFRYRAGISKVFSTANKDLNQSSDSHQNLTVNSESWIKQASEINKQMEQVIMESEQRSVGADYDAVGSSPNTNGQSGSQTEGGVEIKAIREQTRSLLREESFFTELTDYVHHQSEAFGKVKTQTFKIVGMQGTVAGGNAEAGDFSAAVSEAGAVVDRYVTQISGELSAEETKIKQQRAREEEIKSAEKAAKGQLKKATSLISKLADLKDSYNDQQALFNTLKSYYDNNIEFNEEAVQKDESQSSQTDDIYQAGDSSMKGMDQVYGSLASILNHIADNGFETEYAAEYFQEFDVTLLKSLFEGGSLGADAALFSPKQQELEYLLYGFHNPGGNLAAAFGEIFSMRLAIRTMEGFIVNANKGHPLVILAAALLYGVEQAVADMFTLVRTGSVKISKYIDVPLSYKDHLRLFMLVHGKSNARLSRMLALIHLNTGISAEDRATYAEGEAVTTIPLLFLPGITEAMNAVYSGQGEIEGGSYIAVKHAADSY